MLLRTITGLSNASIKVDNSISSIIIIKKRANFPTAGDITTLLFESERITVSANDNSGAQNKIMSNIAWKDVSFISQMAKGHIGYQLEWDNYYLSTNVELTSGASLDLIGNSHLVVDLTGLIAANTYEVYGLEMPIVSDEYIEYSTQSINSTEPTVRQHPIPLNAKSVAIKNTSQFASLKLLYESGRETTYLPEELKTIMREVNPITCAPDKMIVGDAVNDIVFGGATDMFYFPLSGVSKIEISTNGGEVVYFLVTSKQLN